MESSTLVWTRPSWRKRVERWICERLTELDYRLIGALAQPHVRPWGTVLRVPTDGGTLWFKANIAPLAFEATLVDRLGARTCDAVPRLVAADASSGWMLMEDAGTVLTEVYGDTTPLETWQRLLRAYAQLQSDVAPDADALVAGGVPDRRLSNLVEPLERVLATDRLVRPPTDTALTADELTRVRSLIPRLREAADALAALDLPDSVQHDDLHPWNVCVRGTAYRFIDWGDACVAQPLLSLAIPLAHIDGRDADAARDAYLEPWTVLRSRNELLAACDAALLLGHVTGVLKWELISSGLSDGERVAYLHAIPTRLRRMLSLACA